ncbi:DUF4232 domain-containing protein [Streptomyces erythrochromogenes]|uniref:DUF4232 domain-containing protein n=1 Tax=Streptomyces erythrochromogenes TaxID=285574 RepID=UPI00369440CF
MQCVWRCVMSGTVCGFVVRFRMRVALAAGVVAVGLPAAAVAAAVPVTAVPAAVQGVGSVAAAVPPCGGGQLVPGGAVRVGADGVRVTVVNEGPGSCVLRGYPTVALAGQGSPGNARALTVTGQGPARPVVLPPGGAAQTRIGFAPVLGEADGYCASGAEPFVAPSMVVGVAGARLQLGPDDGGSFAVCGTAVRATAFRPVP